MIELPTEAEPVRVIQDDCLEVMPQLPADTFDSVVSDPPYGLGFMGKQWDHGVPGVPFWTEVRRVLKPGGYMLVMGGSRTYHRLACAVEDAGFEIRDCLMWVYGSGFPKAKSCLKPAYEPILLCRKPGKGMRELGIDECRIPANGERLSGGAVSTTTEGWDRPWKHDEAAVAACRERSAASVATAEALGRWPANVLHDGSEEVMEAFAVFGESSPKLGRTGRRGGNGFGYFDDEKSAAASGVWPADAGGTAARFFYCAKASRAERDAGLEGMPLVKCGTMQDDSYRWEHDGKGNKIELSTQARNTHPTVKPIALMKWLVKLVTPPDGLTLDPFAGSGTTGKAAANTGRRAVLIEREAAYADIARRRVAEAMGTGLLAGIA